MKDGSCCEKKKKISKSTGMKKFAEIEVKIEEIYSGKNSMNIWNVDVINTVFSESIKTKKGFKCLVAMPKRLVTINKL